MRGPYRPLAQDEVRIVHIEGPCLVDEPDSNFQEFAIRCRLEHVKLPTNSESTSDTPLYTALSYVCGNQATCFSRRVLLDGHLVSVTPNLFDVLTQLVRQDDPAYRTLWIDALCIHQNDPVEKSQQVQKMHHIYRRAPHVLVWLGTGAGSNGEKLSKYWAYLGDHSTQVDGDEKGPGQDILEEGRRWIKDSRYFTRVWTFQEIVLARRIIVQCGPFRVSWADFRKNSGLDDLIEGVLQTKRDMGSDRLVDLVYSTIGRQATDARDMTYALLGLYRGSRGLEADYNLPLPNVDVMESSLILEETSHLFFVDLLPEFSSIETAPQYGRHNAHTSETAAKMSVDEVTLDRRGTWTLQRSRFGTERTKQVISQALEHIKSSLSQTSLSQIGLSQFFGGSAKWSVAGNCLCARGILLGEFVDITKVGLLSGEPPRKSKSLGPLFLSNKYEEQQHIVEKGIRNLQLRSLKRKCVSDCMIKDRLRFGQRWTPRMEGELHNNAELHRQDGYFDAAKVYEHITQEHPHELSSKCECATVKVPHNGYHFKWIDRDATESASASNEDDVRYWLAALFGTSKPIVLKAYRSKAASGTVEFRPVASLSTFHPLSLFLAENSSSLMEERDPAKGRRVFYVPGQFRLSAAERVMDLSWIPTEFTLTGPDVHD